MEELEDELDLRYHRGLQPDVYYRCPTLESLDGALRNELDKNASILPVATVTEFIFAAASTITVPVAQQPALDALIEPAEYLQSITVDYTLCRDIDGKARLKVQRAIARSIIEAIQGVDGFKYAERSAQSKDGGDGARFKYICRDSVQFMNKKSHKKKKEKPDASDDSEDESKQERDPQLQGYECGGAVHIKFSLKREAVNVVYKHTPIHSCPPAEDSLPALAVETAATPQAENSKPTNGNKEQKKKRKKKDQGDIENDYHDPDLDMSTSPEAPRTATTNKRKKKASTTSPESTRKSTAKKTKKSKAPLSPSTSRKKIRFLEPTMAPLKIRGKACIRCREKKIKCNEGKPTCNQCERGLWTCQYELAGAHKRSKNGCINCKAKRRKCTEERPSCSHCLRVDDDCEYANYS